MIVSSAAAAYLCIAESTRSLSCFRYEFISYSFQTVSRKSMSIEVNFVAARNLIEKKGFILHINLIITQLEVGLNKCVNTHYVIPLHGNL